jgi:hypothetical protein
MAATDTGSVFGGLFALDAQAPAAPAPPSPNQTMLDHVGNAVSVPVEHVASATSKGYKPAVRMQDSDGNHVVVPAAHAEDLLKRGYKTRPQRTVPENNTRVPTQSDVQSNPLATANRQMMVAMTGQGRDFATDPMLTPEERRQAEAGRRAGTIAGGTQIAFGAAAPIFEAGASAIPGVVGKVLPKVAPYVAPIIRAGTGAAIGGGLGEQAGGVFGPKGAKIGSIGGSIAGGLYGALGGTLPSKGTLLKNVLTAAEPEAEATVVSKNPFKLTPPLADTEPAVQNPLNFPKTSKPSPFDVPKPGEAFTSPARMPRSVTMAQPEIVGARPIGGLTAEEQFQNSFGPEEKHVMGQAEWDTGNKHGNFPKPPSETLPGGDIPKGSPTPFGKSKPIDAIGNILEEQLGGKPPAPPVKSVPLNQQPGFKGPRPIGAAEPPAEAPKAEPESAFEKKSKEERQDFYTRLGPKGLDVTRVDLREALINAGEDMSGRQVTDAKALGEGAMTRREAIKILHDKGYTPEQIAKMGKPKK